MTPAQAAAALGPLTDEQVARVSTLLLLPSVKTARRAVQEVPASRRCEIDGCTKAKTARGWCPMHYERWRITGYPLGRDDPRWQAAHPQPAPPTREEILRDMREALAALNEVAS